MASGGGSQKDVRPRTSRSHSRNRRRPSGGTQEARVPPGGQRRNSQPGRQAPQNNSNRDQQGQRQAKPSGQGQGKQGGAGQSSRQPPERAPNQQNERTNKENRDPTRGDKGGKGKAAKDQASNAKAKDRLEDMASFSQMEQSSQVRRFLRGPLFKKKQFSADEFLQFTTQAVEIEKNNMNVRHQFLIRLTRSTFLEMNGPIVQTIINLATMGTNEKTTKSLLKLLEVIEQMLTRIPHCINTIPYCTAVLTLIKRGEYLAQEVREKVNTIYDVFFTDFDELRRVISEPSQQWSPDLAFIGEPILPEDMEFLNESLDARFKNPQQGGYQTEAHYLETWFRLMREDFIGPLRTAIKDFQKQREENGFRVPNRLRLDGGYHYTIQKIEKFERIDGDLCCLLRCDMTELQHVDWSNTGRHRFDSVMIFSDDFFKTACYGVVMRHETKPARSDKGFVWVRIIGDRFSLNRPFHAIEPMAFYEPYRCVLERLKILAYKIDQGWRFPMEKYIVECAKVIDYPQYSGQRSTGTLALPKNRTTDARRPNLDLGLDPSQKSALELALTHELALIQGPPGTGKSYVGAMFVHIMMLNKHLWQEHGRGRILLMAYKNHAIDQFIGECEGMGVDMSGTVRIGGGGGLSVQKYSLRNKRTQLGLHEYRDMNDRARALKKKMWEICVKIELCQKTVDASDEAMPLEHFQFYVPQHFWIQWRLYGSFDEYRSAILEWIRRGEAEENYAVEYHGVIEAIEYHHAVEIYQMYPNIHHMRGSDRRRLFHHWCQQARDDAEACIEELSQYRQNIKANLLPVLHEQDIAVVQRSDIVAMTTTGASKHSYLLEKARPAIVLVEEAAEILESHVVAPLTSACKHIVLIGDHQQLRPSIENYSLERRNLHISLFERLIQNEVPSRRLQIQHRMHPTISKILVPHIYDSLENHERVSTYPEIRGVTKRMVFLNHAHNEEKVGEKASCRNKFEAEYLVALCHYILQQDYDPKDVTILVTYTGQLRLVKQKIDEYTQSNPEPQFSMEEKIALMKEEFSDYLESIDRRSAFRLPKHTEDKIRKKYELVKKKLDQPWPKLKRVRVTTVDNYQGEECNIILLSFVRSNARCNIGFLKWANRICVALSRAKHGFYALGNFDLFAQNTQSSLWKKLCDQLRSEPESALSDQFEIKCTQHGTVQVIKGAKWFRHLSPHGGCRLPCDYRLNCGHVCTRLCHGYDLDHRAFVCMKPCPSNLDCGHKCTKLCCQFGDDRNFADAEKFEGEYRTCQECTKKLKCFVMREVVPECKHPGNVICSYFEQYVCEQPVVRKLLCGHDTTAACYIDPSTIKCVEIVPDTLACGHGVQRPCHNKELSGFKCKKIVVDKLECGHEVQRFCHDKDLSKFKCEVKVKDKLECDHDIERPCYYKDLSKVFCQVIVPIQLPCEHEKRVPCGAKDCDTLCMEKVELVLACKHRRNACCHDKERAKSRPCTEDARIELECKHEKVVKCIDRDNDESRICTRDVEIELPCEHKVLVPCSQSKGPLPGCKKTTRHMLECNHYVDKQCGKSAPLCQVSVTVELPCTHRVKIECHKKSAMTQGISSEVKCTAKVTTTLECGHRVKKPCGKPSPLCLVPQSIKLPCGHRYETRCHKKSEFTPNSLSKVKCIEEVKEIRECGHYVEAQCCDLKIEKAKPCEKPVGRVQMCGHPIEVKCCEKLTTKLKQTCEKKCLVICSHQELCRGDCNEACFKCIKRCDNRCAHSRCSKRCFEECDRQPCNEPCRKTLQCGHDCGGVCGELCPLVCAQCRPTARQGRRVRIKPCNHDFLPDQLDKHMQVRGDTLWEKVVVKQCPVCEAVISYCPRYANQIKRYQLLAKVHDMSSRDWWYCKIGRHFLSSPKDVCLATFERHHRCEDYSQLRLENLYNSDLKVLQRQTTSRLPPGLLNNAFFRDICGKDMLRDEDYDNEAGKPKYGKAAKPSKVRDDAHRRHKNTVRGLRRYGSELALPAAGLRRIGSETALAGAVGGAEGAAGGAESDHENDESSDEPEEDLADMVGYDMNNGLNEFY